MSIRHLSMSDRSRIEVYLELGWSIGRIAKEIKFSKQTISREVRRNRNRQGNYTAITADRLTKARRHQAFSFSIKVLFYQLYDLYITI